MATGDHVDREFAVNPRRTGIVPGSVHRSLLTTCLRMIENAFPVAAPGVDSQTCGLGCPANLHRNFNRTAHRAVCLAVALGIFKSTVLFGITVAAVRCRGFFLGDPGINHERPFLLANGRVEVTAAFTLVLSTVPVGLVILVRKGSLHRPEAERRR